MLHAEIVAGDLQTGRAESIHASFIAQQFSRGLVKFFPKEYCLVFVLVNSFYFIPLVNPWVTNYLQM